MDARGLEAREQVSASRKLSRGDAKKLVKAASLVVVAKGKKVSRWKPGGKAPAEVVDALLGPTGNLRAPTIVAGKTLLVGFNEEVFEETFG